MAYYLYQCARCATTLYSDALPEGESYTYIMNGELCSTCQAEQEQEDWDDGNDDDD